MSDIIFAVSLRGKVAYFRILVKEGANTSGSRCRLTRHVATARGPRPNGTSVVSVPREAGISWCLAIFLMSYIFPPETCFTLGGLLLSPQRLVLLVLFAPSLYWLVTKESDRWCGFDSLVSLHAVWAIVALSVNHGLLSGAKTGGIYVVETLGAYVVGRSLITGRRSFYIAVAVLVGTVLILPLFTVPESVMHKPYLRQWFATVLGKPGPVGSDVRYGFARAYGPFQHCILYGIFCATTFGLSWYVIGRQRIFGLGRLSRGLLISLATLASLSSGALSCIVMQGALVCWDALTSKVRGRWYWLLALMAGCIMFAAIFAKRDLISVFVSYCTLDPSTGYWRKLIWEFGSAEVRRHPIFGIGMSDWIRPEWMHSSSVDNFWLLTAMRYGIPSVLFLLCAVVGMSWCAILANKRISLADRMGWLVSVAALSIVGCTVHYWFSSLTFYFFLLGAGSWSFIDPVLRAAPQMPGRHR